MPVISDKPELTIIVYGMVWNRYKISALTLKIEALAVDVLDGLSDADRVNTYYPKDGPGDEQKSSILLVIKRVGEFWDVSNGGNEIVRGVFIEPLARLVHEEAHPLLKEKKTVVEYVGQHGKKTQCFTIKN